MRKAVNTLLVAFVALFLNTTTVAQDIVVVENDLEFKVDLTEELKFFNLENGTITQWNNVVSFDVLDKGHVEVTLPVYNDPNDPACGSELAWQLYNGVYGTSGTGLGDLGVQFTYDDVFSFKNVSFDVVAGIGVPLTGAFSSSEFVFSVGTKFDFTIDKVNVEQSVIYTFVDDYTYSPYFGGFVNSGILECETNVKYAVSDKATLSGDVFANFADGQTSILVGPSLTYSLYNNVNLRAGIAFAVVDELEYDSLDSVVSFGLQLKF